MEHFFPQQKHECWQRETAFCKGLCYTLLCATYSLSCARSTHACPAAHFRADGEQVTRHGTHFLKLLCTQAWIHRPQWPVVPEAYSFPRQGDTVTSYWHWLLDVYIVNICNLKRYRFQNSWWTCGCWWINVLWYLPLVMQKLVKWSPQSMEPFKHCLVR